MNKERYCISYLNHDDKWFDVYAFTKKEAIELYNMIGTEASFKVVYDIVNGNQLECE